MLSTIRSLLKDESGATAIEYALLVAGIAVTLFAALGGVTGSIGNMLTAVNAVFNAARP